MAELWERIRSAVADGRWVVGNHADDRLRERKVPAWQVEAGVAAAQLLRERPGDQPNPCAEVAQVLADGTPIKAVWSWLHYNKVAKLVTVHFFDR